MTATRRMWLIWSAVAAVLLAAAAGLWFAHARGRSGSAVAASGVRMGDERCAISHHSGAPGAAKVWSSLRLAGKWAKAGQKA